MCTSISEYILSLVFKFLHKNVRQVSHCTSSYLLHESDHTCIQYNTTCLISCVVLDNEKGRENTRIAHFINRPCKLKDSWYTNEIMVTYVGAGVRYVPPTCIIMYPLLILTTPTSLYLVQRQHIYMMSSRCRECTQAMMPPRQVVCHQQTCKCCIPAGTGLAIVLFVQNRHFCEPWLVLACLVPLLKFRNFSHFSY
jgi:hypothetical protein